MATAQHDGPPKPENLVSDPLLALPVVPAKTCDGVSVMMMLGKVERECLVMLGMQVLA